MKLRRLTVTAFLLGSASLVAVLAQACHATLDGSGFGGTPPGTDGGGPGDDFDGAAGSSTNDGGVPLLPPGSDGGQQQPQDSGTYDGEYCTHLQCQQNACDGGAKTTISGKVYDPAGKNPLYNVVVYVPNGTPAAFPQGATCASCDSLYTGDPIAVAVTGTDGSFVLDDAPAGASIPLVIQVGKWRKQTTVANVTACQDNPQPDKSLTLPTKTDAKDDLPNIAISTGNSDTLECLLARVGVDPSEWVGGAGAGHIHIFQGNGGTTASGTTASYQTLWDTTADLMKYDVVLLSCEGGETGNMNQQALHDYASGGGRVFASHFHYSWFNSGPYASENIASWATQTQDYMAACVNPLQQSCISDKIAQTLPNGSPFPKGVALDQWLGNVGALVGGELPVVGARHNALVTAGNTPSTTWITADSTESADTTQYFSFNTPTNAALDDAGDPEYCGRVVYSDLHVGGASNDNMGLPIPAGECANADLSPQEKALEFMLFDLSSCVSPDNKPPPPPK